MERLRIDGADAFITDSVPFRPAFDIPDNHVEAAFNFAWNMTFGSVGAHRDHRTGGSEYRKKGQIFINCFQGKLSEFAAKTMFERLGRKVSEIDLGEHPLGIWDSGDLLIDGLSVAVKSTKHYGNLLLLESQDWTEDGEYLPDPSYKPDAIVLMRVSPDGEALMREMRLLYSESADRNKLFLKLKNAGWRFDSPGHVSREYLIRMVREQYIIRKGQKLNGSTAMDAENYYCQSGSMIGNDRLGE